MSLFLVASPCTIDCPERLIVEMTYYVFCVLDPTPALTQLLSYVAYTVYWVTTDQ